MVIALAACLIPIGLCIVAAFPTVFVHDARAFATRAIVASTGSFALALFVAAGVIASGPSRILLLGYRGIGVSVYVDVLAAIMAVLVSFVGVAVVRYSRNYLDGDPGHLRFTRLLLVTLASVETQLIAGNLAIVVLAMISTSLTLNKLLLFYRERTAAQRAAAKKFVTSRLADLCLIVASCLLYALLGTLEIPDLIATFKANGAAYISGQLTLAALLIITTAVLKSAQVPLHGWLLEVMETPTPVSALLHAGIINAGGFLMLRLADILVIATPALNVVAMIGGATALIASLVMLTQTAVKVQLAWSTIAQMGFMLLQCGLGAFASALLHIIAHSLYKAHAFLSSASIMDLARASWTPSPGGQPHPARLVVALSTVTGLTVAAAWMFGLTPRSSPAQIALGCVLLMGLVHLFANAIDEHPSVFVVSRAAVRAATVAGIYFALQVIAQTVIAGSVPVARVADGTVEMGIAVLVVISFGAVTVFQNQLMRRADAPFWIAAYVHLTKGLYLNTLSNRVVLAIGPKRLSRASSNPS